MQIGQSPWNYLSVDGGDLNLSTPYFPLVCGKNDLVGKGWLKPFVERLSGQVVLDLGAGLDPSCYEVASAGGARAYIGVEKYFAKELERNLAPLLLQHPNTSGQVIDLDMLEYLRVLPNRSVSIVAAGIDDCIIRSEEKREAISAEIFRVLHPEGVLLSYLSKVVPEGLETISRVETLGLTIYKVKQ